MDFPWAYAAAAFLVAYLCGSIPTSVWWGKAFHGIDVREHGSRNAGATNTYRVLGPKAALPVLLIDVLKGFLPVRILPHFSGLEVYSEHWMTLRVILVMGAVIGHLYPVFAGFRGGKGIATSLGGVLALHVGAALVCVLVWMVVFFWRRFVSLASLVAALAFPIAVTFIYKEPSDVLRVFAWLLCAMVFYTHRQNIGRLLRGEEQRLRTVGRDR